MSERELLISKLRWARECGGSEKQMNDCRAVYEVNLTNLNQDYMKQWASFLEVENLLARIQREADTAS